ncbi:MAG TPA: [protein-PII] uridylyltransferase [Actinomycetes bacterium]|nr:[protein-PII] uridylyltransferase [Actinomycetes bacterium]
MLSSVRVAEAVTLADAGAPARRRACAVDRALARLAQDALRGYAGVALVAVGGYGRGELSPLSDVDLLVVTRDGEPPRERLQQLLYPLWDAGMEVGHAVRSPDAAVEHALGDPDAATALLSARLVAGDAGTFELLLAHRAGWLEAHGRELVRSVLERTAERHRRVQRAGWVLAPDLKQDVGGLRDLHTVAWVAAAAGAPGPSERLTAAGELLLAVREALHAGARRRNDRVRIDLQPALARRLGFDGPEGVDQLMAQVHTAARTVEHLGAIEAQLAAERVLGGPRRSGRVVDLGHGVRIEDGVLNLARADRSGARPAAALRLLAAVAATDRPLAVPLHAWLARCFERRGPLDAWDPGTRAAFLELLPGPAARRALELLDHVGGWPVLLPEWARIRGLAQYDLYHRHTVDGHLFATVAELSAALADSPVAREAADQAGDLGTLYLAALLHDAGKGSGTDHSAEGERLAREAGRRMRLDPAATDELATLVGQHLLLVTTATRRDLDDPAVIRAVAGQVGSARRLRLLYLLTVADARATGPEAWTGWKDALVRELYRKTLRALDTSLAAGGRLGDDVAARAREVAAHAPDLAADAERLLRTFPDSYPRSASVGDIAGELRLLLPPPRPGEVRHLLDTEPSRGHPVLAVCVPDRPGTLARTAGVLALNRISVLRAQAYSTTGGFALERFVVDPTPQVRWGQVRSDLEAAFAGRIAIEARLERKARDYRGGAAREGQEPDVRVLADASERFSVVEVRAGDALGLLYAITAALSDLDLDIHVAKIDTLGSRVVDVFYVRTAWGAKLPPEQAGEVRLAVRHRVARLGSGPG